MAGIVLLATDERQRSERMRGYVVMGNLHGRYYDVSVDYPRPDSLHNIRIACAYLDASLMADRRRLGIDAAFFSFLSWFCCRFLGIWHIHSVYKSLNINYNKDI
jgi:hypothetical protein